MTRDAAAGVGRDHRPTGAADRGRPGLCAAIVFDLDGVLVDSLPVMREAFACAYAEVVGPGEPPFEEYCRHLGKFFPDIMREMRLPFEMYEPFVRESDRLRDRIALYPGVLRVVERLRAEGIRCGVATGKTGSRARDVLARVGLLESIEVVCGGDDVARPKPAPDCVLAVLEELDATPADGVYVGDALADLECSRAAGVLFALAAWGDDVAGLRELKPDVVLEKPDDLLALAGVDHH